MKRALVLVAMLACKRTDDDPKKTTALPPTPFDEVDVDLPPGSSDLALDDRGHLWSIAERDRVISEIELTDNPIATRVTHHPVDGVPDGVDTEAIAWLGGGKFAIGTEGQQEATAAVMFGELGTDGRIAIHPALSFTNDQLGVVMTKNHGVESLCGRGDDLLVGIESWGTLPDGGRWSPLIRLHGGAVTEIAKLRLTSDRGKLSALYCTFAPDGTADVIGIERHYGVSRILAFSDALGAKEITPKIAMDLWTVVRDRYHEKLNLEGIVTLADGRWVMVNDNQGAQVDGPTKLFVFHSR